LHGIQPINWYPALKKRKGKGQAPNSYSLAFGLVKRKEWLPILLLTRQSK